MPAKIKSHPTPIRQNPRHTASIQKPPHGLVPKSKKAGKMPALMNTDYILDTTAEAVQKAVHTVTLIFLFYVFNRFFRSRSKARLLAFVLAQAGQPEPFDLLATIVSHS